jgi:hypothetical protein
MQGGVFCGAGAVGNLFGALERRYTKPVSAPSLFSGFG